MTLIKDFISVFSKPKVEISSVPIVRTTLNYEQTKEIGVLFSHSNDDNPKAINYFVKLLQKDHKQVRALAYFEERHSNPYDFRFDFFTAKEIDSKGKIQSLQVEEFIKREFDYLYCVNTADFAAFDYIMQRSHAKCRIGKYYSHSLKSFEIMVDIGDNTNAVDLILQMLHYTKTLIIQN
jgi:hypothetical protein